MIQLEVGKQYWHIFMFPVAVAAEVVAVKKYWFLQRVTLKPIYEDDGGPYDVWSSTAGFSEHEFMERRVYDGND